MVERYAKLITLNLQVLASIDPGSVLYARTLPTFRAICRRSGCLPSSCYLAEEVVLESPHPLHQTALSDVYQGHIGSLRVALKSLRLHSDNRSKTEKVGSPSTLCVCSIGLIAKMIAPVLLWRSHGMAVSPTPEHHTVSGRIDNLPGVPRQ